MGLKITKPTTGNGNLVGEPGSGSAGKVYASGNGAIDGGTAAVAVYGKVYQPPAEPTNPLSGPPTDAVLGTVENDGYWNIGLTGTAICNQAGTAENEIYVWAEHGTSSPIYSVVSKIFGGKCTTGTPS